MDSLSLLTMHHSFIVKRTQSLLADSKYVVRTEQTGDDLFSFQKNGKTAGRGRQLLLLDSDQRPVLLLQITDYSPLYALCIGSAQMSIHSLPGGNFLGKVMMIPGFRNSDAYQIADSCGRSLMTFKRKEKLISFSYKFKNPAGVPIAKISSVISASSSKVKVDFHPGLDQKSRILLIAAAFLITKVEAMMDNI